MEAAALKLGHTVLAQIPDPDGNACVGPHPAMILQPPNASGNLWLLGITSEFSLPLERLTIELPWKVGGHPETGLWKRCVLKCWWFVPWRLENITCRLGKLGPDIVESATDYAITARNEQLARKSANQ